MTQPVGLLTTRPTPTTTRTRGVAHWLALGAVIGPVLFSLAWLILGFLSPGYPLFGTMIAPYSVISQPISGLGLGSTAPYMNTAFVLGGVLLLVGVVAISHTMKATAQIVGGRPNALASRPWSAWTKRNR